MVNMAAACLSLVAAAGQSDASAGGAVKIGSVWDFLVKGGPMMIPIGLCSLAALTVIVERVVSLRRSQVIPPGFGERLAVTVDRDRAVAYCRDNPSPIANVLLAGLKHSDAPESVRERRVQEAGEREVYGFRKHLRVLSVVAALAPVMGLLGTVFGMIKAFQTVAISGEALGKTELLAQGIYEALITTAAGLVLAIPVLIAYHWITSKIERLVHEMDRMIVEFFENCAPVVAAGETFRPRSRPVHLADADVESESAAVAPA